MPDDHRSRGADDGIVLVTLVVDSPLPWSVDELIRQYRDRIGVEDALARLQDVGLVHRLGEFVWPTRTARVADKLFTTTP
ncbi:MAG TPA: hypothetical protein VGF95_08055 [Solirubrobacteraceae bacterium]|jgi:hypothetical protein